MSIHDLARRIHLRLLQHRRKHPHLTVTVDPAMSRILENDPSYAPYRPRSGTKRRPPLLEPSIFTVQRIAHAVGTTVGDLLGERAYELPSERLTSEQRRTLRDALVILRDLFDLGDPEL